MQQNRFVLLGSFVAVAVVAALAFFVLPRLQLGKRAATSLEPGAIIRLAIPEAHAGDAFALAAEKSDAAGMDVDTALIVKAKVPVTAEQLSRTLRVIPAMETTVRQTAPDTFKILPKEPLKPGTVYRITLAAQTKKTDGSAQLRDFSWALQTKNDLRVLSAIPGDALSRVPVDTGMEFKFTYANVENVQENFSIRPETKGRFEAHGRVVAFVPEQPLRYGTKYEIILKKGIRVAKSDLALSEDVRMRFETESQRGDVTPPKPRFFVTNEFGEIAPGKEIFLTGWFHGGASVSSTIEVTGHRLSAEETRELLQNRFSIPRWAPVQAEKFEDYKRLAKNQAFKIFVAPQRANAWSDYTLALPKVDALGAYAVKLLPKDGEETWMLLQVTEHATYFLGDKNVMQLWVVNAATDKAAGNIPVKSGPVEGRTDPSGVVRLSTELLVSTSTGASNGEKEFFLLDVGEGADVYHSVFWKSHFTKAWNSSDYGRYRALSLEKTWSFLHIDRPLYRGTDELRISGFAQDRDSRRGAGEIVLQLVKQSFWYDWFGDEKTYQEAAVKTDESGHYQAAFAWNEMAAGYYEVRAVRDGVTVGVRPFEIRDFVKPAYFISVSVNQNRMYAGGVIDGSATVRFYDGTPFAKGTFRLEARYGNDRPFADLELMTDANGMASFSVPTPALPCGEGPKDWCPASDSAILTVRPKEGEEAQINGVANVEVLSTDLRLDAYPATSGTHAIVDVKSLRIDLRADAKPQSWGNRALKGTILASYWERIETGTYYDFYQKKTLPQYSYERREDQAVPFSLTTDDAGNGRHAFVMDPNKQYEVVIEGMDDKGRRTRTRRYLAVGWDEYEQRFVDDGYGIAHEDKSPRLAFESEDKFEFVEDETVKVRYQLGKEPLDTVKTPGVLFVVASRGLRKTELAAGPSWSFRFDRDLFPAADIRAVTFKDGHFQSVRSAAFLDSDSRGLEIEAKPDRDKYAPGATVNMRVIVKTKKGGERVPRVKVTLAAVDKSIEALTFFPEEDPIRALFGYVGDGIVLESGSHDLSPSRPQSAGAEMGGGGGDGAAAQQVRRIFKDTAAFVIAETDRNGEAELTFKVPDNLTTWRTQLVGISSDVRAGALKMEIPVTKEMFVDAVAPPRLLTKDKPVLKLRAYGVSLREGDDVQFVVDAPTLGIANQRVAGKAFQAAYVAIDKLVSGRHAVVLRVTTPRGTDALERIVTVADTRFTQDVETVVEALPGASLPDIGVAQELGIRFESKAQGSLIGKVRSLSHEGWSPRVDAQIASRMMMRLLKDLYKDESVSLPEDSLRDYMDAYGAGIRLLPHASPDPELTAEVAATAPEFFDQQALQGHFYGTLENKNANRELQISALAGLAALHEPVLPMLQAMAEQKDLSWRERLVIARGLVGAGDREGAGAILEELLNKSETRGTVMWLAVSGKAPDMYEATADAAALAASLAHPKAEPLMKYVDENWSDEAFPLLARARYLNVIAPLRPAGDVSVSYSTDGKTEKTLSLREWPVQNLTLTAEETRAFRVTKATGPVVISFLKRVAGRPASKPEITVSRIFESTRSITDLQEGDAVRVRLKAEWREAAQDGCYSLRDHLPGGFQPVINSGYAPYEDSYAYAVKDGEVSFYVCKDMKGREIAYFARAVARGTYTAEAPALQHLAHPSVAALGADQEVIVK